MAGNKLADLTQNQSKGGVPRVAPKGDSAVGDKGWSPLWAAPASPVTRWRPIGTDDLGNYLEKPRGSSASPPFPVLLC